MTITSSTNTIDEIRSTVDQTLEELRPMAEAYENLKKFRDHAFGQMTNNGSRPKVKVKTHKARINRKRNTPTPKLSMSDKVLATVINHKDGVSISEVAGEVRTATSYVYRIARKLESDGQIQRREKLLLPV